MNILPSLLTSLLIILPHVTSHNDGRSTTISKLDDSTHERAKERRYLIYAVNPGEGFNLRRDVHMRAANLVRQLREEGENFVVVLPPWGGIPHWRSRNIGEQSRLKWATFFDVKAMNRFVPTIEFEEWLRETNSHGRIENLYYLQHYEEGWGGEWEEKWEVRKCLEASKSYFRMDRADEWYGYFFAYNEKIYANELTCVSIQGYSKTLLPIILHPNNSDAMTLMVDRMETVMHDHFGDVNYWAARKSMRYAKGLVYIADQFRKVHLNSTDEEDETVKEEDWTQQKGGEFISVHWRRKDFLYAHKDEIPSIEGAAKQIRALCEDLRIFTVFMATDTTDEELDELKGYLGEEIRVVQYRPTWDDILKYKDGGVAIVDQWIAAHAKYFIGSHVSTFSYRIQDEREMMGFHAETTFNRLCSDDQATCEQPAKWMLEQ